MHRLFGTKKPVAAVAARALDPVPAAPEFPPFTFENPLSIARANIALVPEVDDANTGHDITSLRTAVAARKGNASFGTEESKLLGGIVAAAAASPRLLPPELHTIVSALAEHIMGNGHLPALRLKLQSANERHISTNHDGSDVGVGTGADSSYKTAVLTDPTYFFNQLALSIVDFAISKSKDGGYIVDGGDKETVLQEYLQSRFSGVTAAKTLQISDLTFKKWINETYNPAVEAAAGTTAAPAGRSAATTGAASATARAAAGGGGTARVADVGVVKAKSPSYMQGYKGDKEGFKTAFKEGEEVSLADMRFNAHKFTFSGENAGSLTLHFYDNKGDSLYTYSWNGKNVSKFVHNGSEFVYADFADGDVDMNSLVALAAEKVSTASASHGGGRASAPAPAAAPAPVPAPTPAKQEHLDLASVAALFPEGRAVNISKYEGCGDASFCTYNNEIQTLNFFDGDRKYTYSFHIASGKAVKFLFTEAGESRPADPAVQDVNISQVIAAMQREKAPVAAPAPAPARATAISAVGVSAAASAERAQAIAEELQAMKAEAAERQRKMVEIQRQMEKLVRDISTLQEEEKVYNARITELNAEAKTLGLGKEEGGAARR